MIFCCKNQKKHKIKNLSTIDNCLACCVNSSSNAFGQQTLRQ